MKKNSRNVKIIALACIVIFVFFNLTVELIGTFVNLKFDCTENRIFNISEQTREFLKTVDEEVVFYYLTQSGEEYPYVIQTMDRYTKECNNIKIKNIDIVRNPLLAEKYRAAGSVSAGTVVVESEKRFKIVDPGSALMVMQSGENVSSTLGFSLEEKLTNAIDFVLREHNPTVKYAQGHNNVDFALPAQKLNDENIAVEKVDILNDEFSVNDTQLLVIYGFREDISETEHKKIMRYLDDGGKLYIAQNPATDCPRLKSIISDYGITINDDAVVEENPSNIIKNNRMYLLVNPTSKVCENLAGKGALIFPATSSLSITENENCDVYSVARTSNTAKTRELIDTALGNDIRRGAADVAVISENGENGSKLFVTATTQVFKPEEQALANVMNSFSYINREFFVQCMKYLIDSEGIHISIAPKSIMSRSTHFTQTTKIVLSCIFSLLPIVLLTFGLFVCIRRKKR